MDLSELGSEGLSLGTLVPFPRPRSSSKLRKRGQKGLECSFYCLGSRGSTRTPKKTSNAVFIRSDVLWRILKSIRFGHVLVKGVNVFLCFCDNIKVHQEALDPITNTTLDQSCLKHLHISFKVCFLMQVS